MTERSLDCIEMELSNSTKKEGKLGRRKDRYRRIALQRRSRMPRTEERARGRAAAAAALA